jgi:hypothetical protein
MVGFTHRLDSIHHQVQHHLGLTRLGGRFVGLDSYVSMAIF